MKWTKVIFILAFGIWLNSCEYNPYAHGQRMYDTYCASCHGFQGEGFRDLYPPLADSDYFQKDPYRAACITVHGYQDSILVNGKVYQQPMLAIDDLNAVEITNILNYIAHSWNPTIVTPLHQDSVKARLEFCRGWPDIR